MGKKRYVSKEEKTNLPKNEKWARLGRSLLKATALTVGGIGAMTAAAFVATPLLYITAAATFTLCSPVYTQVIMNFVDLFTKNKNHSKER